MVGAKPRASLTSELRQPADDYRTHHVARQTRPHSPARLASEGLRERLGWCTLPIVYGAQTGV